MGKTPQRIVELLQAEIPGKISKNKFCIQTGINQNSIDKYMAGITEPTNVSLQKLADYFKVSVAWLRGEKGGTFEDEHKRVMFLLLSGEEKGRFFDRITDELKQTDMQFGAIKELAYMSGSKDTKIETCLAANRAKLKDTMSQLSKYLQCEEKYYSIVSAFLEVPVEEMEHVISVLSFFQRLKEIYPSFNLPSSEDV